MNEIEADSTRTLANVVKYANMSVKSKNTARQAPSKTSLIAPKQNPKKQ